MTTCTSRAAWLNLLRRLHFYIGLFIGPFIFVAALTGTLYVPAAAGKLAVSRRAERDTRRGEAAAECPNSGRRTANAGEIFACRRCARPWSPARPRG